MRQTLKISTLLTLLVLAAGAVGQGTSQAVYQRNSTQSIDQALGAYLNADENTSILTPGEYCEWKLDLKAGDVVISEARSESFDPAIEILDGENVLAANDDRYPGDQRPLLLWRCRKDGNYSLRVRSFKNKAGGQVFSRYNVYQCLDIETGKLTEGEVARDRPILLHFSMKAGEIKEQVTDVGGDHHYWDLTYNGLISSSGLPDTTGMGLIIQPAIYAFIVPVSGDYYVMETPRPDGEPKGKVHVGLKDIVPAAFGTTGPLRQGTGPTNTKGLWELPVKAGEFLQVSTPSLNIHANLLVTERPDFTRYDLAKPATNPFYPASPETPPAKANALTLYPARVGDDRILNFRVWRDTTLWIATDGAGPKDKTFDIKVAPAAADFPQDKVSTATLRVADTDYWGFDAKAGDVMTFTTKSPAFTESLVVRDPDMAEIHRYRAALDVATDTWRMVVQKPGRYLVAVSCVGNGGGGTYSLSRDVLHAREFSMSSPAKGEIAKDDIQIWKFTATPDKPLLIHWTSTSWPYEVAIYDDKGNPTNFQRDGVDDHNTFGILRVSKPQTYLIVLTGKGEKATYSIELGSIPGYKPPK